MDDITNFTEQILEPYPLSDEDPGKPRFDEILQLFQKDFTSPFDCSIAKQCDDDDDDDDDVKEDFFDVDLELLDKNLLNESAAAIKAEEDQLFISQDEDTTEDNQFDDDDDSYSDGDEDDEEPVAKRPKKAKLPTKLSAEAKKTYDEDLKLYVCPHCNLQLKAGMTNHLKWHKEHPNEKYPSRSTCEHCGKTFKKIGILRAHIVRMHSNLPKKFKCAYEGCDRAFKVPKCTITTP